MKRFSVLFLLFCGVSCSSISFAETPLSTDDKKQAWSCPYSQDQIEEKIERITQLIIMQNNSYIRDFEITFRYKIEIEKLQKIPTTVGCEKFNYIDNKIEEFNSIYDRISQRQIIAEKEVSKGIEESARAALDALK